jgi:quercetin dioxygenase-like cupin family protein
LDVTRLAEARPYDAPRHHGMSTVRLQGADASGASGFTVGLSITLPAGGAEASSSSKERVYVVLEGELTLITPQEEIVLNELDSVWIPPGAERELANRTNRPAMFLVVMSQVEGES